LDTETTGLDPEKDDILEIAFVIFKHSPTADIEIIDSFSSFVNFGGEILPYITAINNITEADVKKAPPVGEVLDKTFERLSNLFVFAHNARFDLSMLLKYDQRFSHIKFIDSRKLAEFVLPGLKQLFADGAYRQVMLQNIFGVTNERQHAALPDATALAHIVDTLLKVARSRRDFNLLNFVITKGKQKRKED
jgi:DNA polymerase-3 subunit epsilon